MFVVVQNMDLTSYVETNTISVTLTQGDQIPQSEFELTDIGSLLNLDAYNEVIILDDRGTLNQAVNFVIDPLFGSNATKYALSGGLSSLLIFNGSPNVTATLSNSAVGTGQAAQTTLVNFIHPGITYYFSMYMQTAANLVNGSAFIQMSFLDASQTVIGGTTQTVSITTSPVRTRYIISGLAPANTAYVQIAFGVTTTSSTNSGSVTFSSPQLEPAWFAYKGQQYPSPDCNANGVGCVVVPNGTSVRQNRIFLGSISKIKANQYDGPNRILHITCAHITELIDLKLVNKTYNTSYDNQIINDVLTTSYTGILTGSQVWQGKQFDSITFEDSTFKDVLNAMADNTSFVYKVTNYADLVYAPPYTLQTAFRFVDNATPDYITTFPLNEYTIEKDFTQKASRIKLHGGKGIAPAITDTFSGNASNKVFTLTNQPYSVSSVQISGVGQKTGIKGVNTLGQNGYVAVVDKANSQLTFQNAPASASNNVTITYTYEANIYVQEDDVQSISRFGTTFERRIQDTALLSTNAAFIRAIQELIQFSQPRVLITAKSLQFIEPGYAVQVTSERDNLFQQLLVCQSCKTVALGNDYYEYQIQLGFYKPDLVDRVKHLSKALNRSKSTANQPLQGQNLFVMDSLYYGGDSISATAQYTQAQYGQARWGYASYGPPGSGGTPHANTYGSNTSIYGTTTWG